MPAIEQTIADINVRSHTFRFVSPAQTEAWRPESGWNSAWRDLR
jgi:hypothetical protein